MNAVQKSSKTVFISIPGEMRGKREEGWAGAI